jgi:hypothetical protein
VAINHLNNSNKMFCYTLCGLKVFAVLRDGLLVARALVRVEGLMLTKLPVVLVQLCISPAYP